MDVAETSDNAMELLFAVAAFLTLPTLLYFVGSRSKDVWGLVRKGKVMNGTGLYRAAPTTVWACGNAPVSVRVAAFTSFLLGQMIIPGAFAALVGFVAVLGMLSHQHLSVALLVIQGSAPTGLIVAWRLLGAGSAILRRAPDAVAEARKAARWELWHNGVLGAGLVISAFVGDRDERTGCLMVAVPVVLALAHGVLLVRAAFALEAYNAAQDPCHDGVPCRGPEPEPEPAVGGGFAPAAR